MTRVTHPSSTYRLAVDPCDTLRTRRTFENTRDIILHSSSVCLKSIRPSAARVDAYSYFFMKHFQCFRANEKNKSMTFSISGRSRHTPADRIDMANHLQGTSRFCLNNNTIVRCLPLSSTVASGVESRSPTCQSDLLSDYSAFHG